MNEWTKNPHGVDMNKSTNKPVGHLVKTTAVALALVTSAMGLAWAGGTTPQEAVTAVTGLLDWSGLYADGAQGGFDAAGVGLGNW